MTTRIGIILLAAMIAACGTSPEPPEHSRPEPQDRVVAAEIKAALIEQAPTAAAAVDVDVRKGVIHLKGFADSPAVRDQLESAARDAAKDRTIVNEIEIR